jgi:GntR family transcriptional regulator/MocR family aminotransferase
MDEDGMRMEALETALQAHQPKLIYTIPTFHNPTGTSLDTQRRRQMVALAQQYNVPIVEDDFVGELRYEGYAQPALKALDTDGSVIYVNTFSKVLVPGLRLGYLVANGPVFEQLVILKRANDRSSSDMMQRALDAYITVGRYQAQLRKVGRIYRRRRNAMLAALEQFMPEEVSWQRPFGGLFLWLQLPDGMDAAELLPIALQEGVAFVPGSSFFVDKRPFPALRLNFTVHEPDVIEAGIKRLAKAIKKKV